MLRERGKERDGWRTERGVGKELKEWTVIEEEGFFFLSGETQARMYKKNSKVWMRCEKCGNERDGGTVGRD